MRRPGTASTSCVVSPSLFNSVVCVLLTFVGRRRIFGAAKAEALVVRAAQEKRAVEHRGRDSAFIKRAVPPRATFECLVLLTVVFTGMGVAGIGLVPGRRPFPHVAGHIVKAERTHPVRKRPHGHGIALLLENDPTLRRVGRVGVELVAPWEHAAVGAARRLFPLLVGGQPLAGPGAIGLGIVPGDLGHRVIGLAWRIGAIAEVGRGAAVGGIDEGLVLLIRYFVHVHPIRGQIDLVLRSFVGQPFGAAHENIPGGDQHHRSGPVSVGGGAGRGGAGRGGDRERARSLQERIHCVVCGVFLFVFCCVFGFVFVFVVVVVFVGLFFVSFCWWFVVCVC